MFPFASCSSILVVGHLPVISIVVLIYDEMSKYIIHVAIADGI